MIAQFQHRKERSCSKSCGPIWANFAFLSTVITPTNEPNVAFESNVASLKSSTATICGVVKCVAPLYLFSKNHLIFVFP